MSWCLFGGHAAAAAARVLSCMKQCVWEFHGSDNSHLNARMELCAEAMIRCYQFSPVCLYFSTLFTEMLLFYPYHTGGAAGRGIPNLKEPSVLFQQTRDLTV